MLFKLKNVRIAFCQNLFVAGAMAGDSSAKPRFSSTFIIAAGDPQIEALRKAIEEVAKEKWGTKYLAILKQLNAGGKTCLHDGNDKPQYDGFEGNMYISAASPNRPGIFDSNKTELTEASGKPYAGCYVHANIEIWAQDNNYGKRINASLKGVMFYKDGDAFVGSVPSEADDFDDVSDTGEESLA